MGFRSFERGDEGSSSGGRFDRRSGGGRNFGGSRGGFDGGRDRFGGDRGGFGRPRDRRDMAPCDAVCAKCGKNCKVPFKPTGDKPVYCSECYSGQREFRNAPSFGGSAPAQTLGVTAEQFKQLSKKVDRILEMLESLEIVDDEEAESEDNAEAVEEIAEEKTE